MLIELKNIVKQYIVSPGTEPVTVLDGVSLTVAPGERIAIVGPSGSGKSTLLNIMGALDMPTSGEVLFEGKPLADMNGNERAALRNRDIGFIFQLHHLLPQCTVLENVLIPTLAGNHARPEDMNHRATELLKQAGLENHLGHFPAQLSGGERQRVAVVRALVNSPKLVLADEPTGSLDHATAVSLSGLLTRLNRAENSALVIVTHSRELAESMDTVYTLRDGGLNVL